MKGPQGSCAPFFYGHRSLHRPTHVPFSPIRSGIAPSLRRAFKIIRGCALRSRRWTGGSGFPGFLRLPVQSLDRKAHLS